VQYFRVKGREALITAFPVTDLSGAHNYRPDVVQRRADKLIFFYKKYSFLPAER
jgi:hypothetical protein